MILVSEVVDKQLSKCSSVSSVFGGVHCPNEIHFGGSGGSPSSLEVCLIECVVSVNVFECVLQCWLELVGV